VGLAAAVSLSWGVGAALGDAAGITAKATALYAAVAAMILPLYPGTLPGPGLGLANRVTLGRMILALPVGALALQLDAPSPAGRWWIVALGTVALALDGLDGRVARRTGTSSAFGARFDMEVDAALIMVLSWLTWTSGQAPAWVLLVGAMRYLFVAAGTVVPALTGELFPSLRRKVVCVVQGAALLAAVSPLIPAGPSTALAGAALAALVWSFAVDSWWLLGHRGRRS
jgi:phosphatidylglycerophosphate synthase